MENDAYYITDKAGVDLALGGLNATLRDYAKFGYLYLNNGNWFGEQIVPEKWVIDSHTPDVDPVSGVVIAKTSSNHRFRSEKDYSKAVHIAMFRAIAKHIAQQSS